LASWERIRLSAVAFSVSSFVDASEVEEFFVVFKIGKDKPFAFGLSLSLFEFFSLLFVLVRENFPNERSSMNVKLRKRREFLTNK
jgi:hypothetical protein